MFGLFSTADNRPLLCIWRYVFRLTPPGSRVPRMIFRDCDFSSLPARRIHLRGVSNTKGLVGLFGVPLSPPLRPGFHPPSSPGPSVFGRRIQCQIAQVLVGLRISLLPSRIFRGTPLHFPPLYNVPCSLIESGSCIHPALYVIHVHS